MEQTNKVFVEGVEVRLNKINYETIRIPENENLNFEAIEENRVLDVDEDHFLMSVTRKVSFTPAEYFLLEVEALIVFHLLKETFENFNNLEELRSYIEENSGKFIANTPVGASLSLLIGQITSTFGQMPLLTPPNLSNENK